MKNPFLIKGIIILALIFSGCSSTSDNNKENLTKKTEESESINLQQKESPIDFGEEFQPPHFQVEGFNVSNTEGDKLSILIDYVFDEELFNFIKENNLEYYYMVIYPSQLGEDINLKKSDYINGERLNESSSQMNYTIEINEDIPEGYNINSITKEPIDFQLVILNKDKYPVHVIDDIYHYLGYDPDLSQSIND